MEMTEPWLASRWSPCVGDRTTGEAFVAVCAGRVQRPALHLRWSGRVQVLEEIAHEDAAGACSAARKQSRSMRRGEHA